MSNFKNQQFKDLNNILISRKIMNQEDADALSYALIEIFKSVEKIYSQIVPQILSAENNDSLKDRVWDLREEFRHIQYHIDDGKLKDL